MRSTPPCIVAGLLFLLLAIPTVAIGETLTNDSVTALHKAGLPASVIVAKIEASEGNFDTSVEALVALAEAGIPDSVIAAMVGAGDSGATQPAQTQQVVHSGRVVEQQAATAAPTVANTFAGTPCPGPGIFSETDNGLKQLDPSAYTGVKTGGLWKAKLTGGIMSVKSQAMITGLSSHNRIRDRSPTFYFCFEETQTGLSYETSGATTPSQFLLVTLDVSEKQNARMLVTGKLNAYTGGYSGPPPKFRKDFAYEKLAAGVYKVTVSGLPSGEYAFFYTGSASAGAAMSFGLVSSGGGGKVFDFSLG